MIEREIRVIRVRVIGVRLYFSNIFSFKSPTGLNTAHSFDLRIFRLQNITFN